jgi:entry exclusion lipoprotein TrbK
VNKFLMIVLPLTLLTGCSSEAPKPQPCPYKNQNDCKERDILQIKSDLYLKSLREHQTCVVARYPMEKQNCGQMPQWKDYK